MAEDKARIGELLEFWFSPAARKRWFDSTPAFDDTLRERFEPLVAAALQGRLQAWERTAEGCLALVILLDQLPLNIYRGEARAFAGEASARAVADRALARGLDAELDDAGKAFLFLPFMHSEDLADQQRSLALHRQAGMETRWAEHHLEIVRRFGRFPHRNAILGRASSTEEQAWLDSDQAFHG